MSRVSDTRLRTREAAAQLVSTGRRSHDLTVDLIYAEIKQGSRTTINDELKLWKDEQAKANALTAALPPAVASAMLNMWALAVEHGEKAFDLRLEEVETHLAKATTSVESLGAEKSGLLQQNESLQAEIARGQSELAAVRELLTAEHVAKENATSRVDALEQQLESVKTDAAQAISIVKAEHRLRVQELQAALATQESSFRQEIDKATERLEGVQKHVMLQVTEAREAQKRAETLLSKTNQKNDQLSAEVQQLGRQIASISQTSERAQADLAQTQGVIDKLRSERESLVQQVATAAGKLGVLEQQVESLERRAVGAETRLETALKRPAAEKRKSGKHHGDLIGE